MAHWIKSHDNQLVRIREILDGTQWSLEIGDSGPLKINHPSGQQITIAKITYTGRPDYYKLERVKSKDAFDNTSDPQREERNDNLDNIVEFLPSMV